MPFITDDYYPRLVDDDEYVQKYKDHFIVRKLYVCLDEPFPDGDYLHRRFKKYGNIESTELLKSGKEGYVTFSCDRHACLAYDREKEKGVKVAYTYHQPRKIEPTHDNDQPIVTEITSALLDLNDDCLYAVFNYCDNKSLVYLSETCTRLKTLLNGSYTFPNNKHFSIFHYVNRCGYLMSLSLVRKILRLIGKYFQTMELEFFQLDDDQVLRCLESVKKHCKTNTFIHGLKIYSYHWNKEYTNLIEPIWKNLQTLEIHILKWNPDEVYRPDFPALCPILRKITTDVCSQTCSTATRPNLESYSYESFSEELINSPNMLEFFANNPQIKTFKCSYLRSHDLSRLAAHLPNIQKLSFVLREVSSSNDFINLKNFKHLTKLKLSFVEMPKVNLRQTIQCFSGFNNLLELKLYFKEKNGQRTPVIQESVIALSKMLPNLERFDLIGLQLMESTVVDFVRFASKIKSLHFHICKVYASKSLITKLLTVRKSSQDELKLFVDDEDRNNAVATQGDDIQQNLVVGWHCKHDLRWVKS